MLCRCLHTFTCGYHLTSELRFFDTVEFWELKRSSLRASLKSRCAESPQEQVRKRKQFANKLHPC
jgi:hypothetical protein